MTNHNKLFLIVLVGLLFALPAFSQTATTSTTLSSAITDSKTNTIFVGSATNINVPSSSHSGSNLFVDGEQMTVTGVNGTIISVVRGVGGTKAVPHVSGATVYVGYAATQGLADAFSLQPPPTGACTASEHTYLPRLSISYPYYGFGAIFDCFGGQYQWDLTSAMPLYKFTVAPQAQRSAVSPSAGNANSITSQAGGASTNASNAGGAGGATAVTAGAGGAGASTGTAGAGGAASLVGGAGGAAAGSGGIGGAGGQVNITAGASGGTITSGAGGSVVVKAGASANGSTAAGNGGNVDLQAGAVGTGGTGAAGKVRLKDATDATKIASFDVSAVSTGNTRVITIPDQSTTIMPVMNHSATAVNASTLHMVRDTCAIGSTCSVTLTGAAVFADTNYVCVATDTTAAAAVKVAISSASAVAFTGTGTDTVLYTCIGN